VRPFAILAAAPFLLAFAAQDAPRGAGTATLNVAGHEILVLAGTPRDAAGIPTAQGGNNCRKRHIWVAEKPYRDTFAGVAAQEMFEKEWCVGLLKPNKRKMELVSHTINVLVTAEVIGARNMGPALGHPDDPACKPTACTLHNYYQARARKMRGYDWLYDLGEEEILRRMLGPEIQAEARAWVDRRRGAIETLKAFRFPR
jgi:hypothetical protein